MLLGYENAEQFWGGLAEWRAEGRYLVVETPDVVQKLIGSGAVLIDVRDASAFAAGHLPGARNVPLVELLADPVATLPGVNFTDGIVVCAEGDGDDSCRIAARALEDAGFRRVQRYGGGFAEWAAAGRPIE